MTPEELRRQQEEIAMATGAGMSSVESEAAQEALRALARRMPQHLAPSGEEPIASFADQPPPTSTPRHLAPRTPPRRRRAGLSGDALVASLTRAPRQIPPAPEEPAERSLDSLMEGATRQAPGDLDSALAQLTGRDTDAMISQPGDNFARTIRELAGPREESPAQQGGRRQALATRRGPEAPKFDVAASRRQDTTRDIVAVLGALFGASPRAIASLGGPTPEQAAFGERVEGYERAREGFDRNEQRAYQRQRQEAADDVAAQERGYQGEERARVASTRDPQSELSAATQGTLRAARDAVGLPAETLPDEQIAGLSDEQIRNDPHLGVILRHYASQGEIGARGQQAMDLAQSRQRRPRTGGGGGPAAQQMTAEEEASAREAMVDRMVRNKEPSLTDDEARVEAEAFVNALDSRNFQMAVRAQTGGGMGWGQTQNRGMFWSQEPPASLSVRRQHLGRDITPTVSYRRALQAMQRTMDEFSDTDLRILLTTQDIPPGPLQARMQTGRSRLWRVLNTLLRARSGAAVTENEMSRAMNEASMSRTSSPEALREFVDFETNNAEALLEVARAGAGPEASALFDEGLSQETLEAAGGQMVTMILVGSDGRERGRHQFTPGVVARRVADFRRRGLGTVEEGQGTVTLRAGGE